VIRKWLDEQGVAQTVLSTLQTFLDVIAAGGPEVVPGVVSPLGKGDLHILKVKAQGHPPISILFSYGPFGNNEMTLLVGVPDKTVGLFKPKDALAIAHRNLGAC
jgi:hypothetical protein